MLFTAFIPGAHGAGCSWGMISSDEIIAQTVNPDKVVCLLAEIVVEAGHLGLWAMRRAVKIAFRK